MTSDIKKLFINITQCLVLTGAVFFIFACNNTPEAWKYPDMSSVPQGPLGDSIKYGKELISKTYKYIGPLTSDTTKRYSGNNLACSNCHLDAGTRPNSLGFVGVYLLYPQYSSRVDTIISIKQRINECMERSMNGKALPLNGNEMNSIVAYYQWISKDVMPKIASEYSGLPKIAYLTRAADHNKGSLVYRDKCMTCHADNGAGVYNDGKAENGFDIPALWGNDCFNNGAGMYRLSTSAAFIKSKMPYHNATLSDEEAWDVAAYVVSMPHPVKPNLDKDFPNLNEKPFDCPYPPYNDTFSVARHKYGPFEGLMK